MSNNLRPVGLECDALWDLYNVLKDQSYLVIKDQLYYVEDVTISVGKTISTYDPVFCVYDSFHRERINIYLMQYVDETLVSSEYVIDISTICKTWRTAEQLMASKFIRIPHESELKNAEMLNVYPVINTGNKLPADFKNKADRTSLRSCSKAVSILMRSLETQGIPYDFDTNGENLRIIVIFDLPGDSGVSQILKRNR